MSLSHFTSAWFPLNNFPLRPPRLPLSEDERERQLLNTKLDSLHRPWFPAARESSTWLPLIDAQRGLSRETLAVFHCLDLWETKNRISLSATIHTGPIKGCSLLLWSWDLDIWLSLWIQSTTRLISASWLVLHEYFCALYTHSCSYGDYVCVPS